MAEYMLMDNDGEIEGYRNREEAFEGFNTYGSGAEPQDQLTWSGDLLLVEVLARRR